MVNKFVAYRGTKDVKPEKFGILPVHPWLERSLQKTNVPQNISVYLQKTYRCPDVKHP